VSTPIDPFTISFQRTSQKNVAYLQLGWDDREYAVDVMVK
jgi:hypothetical protein